MNALKALQPPTTLPVTIPHFEENSGQCFSSDEVEKEELILTSAVNKGDFTSPILAVKEDLGQKLIDDLDEPLMVLESDGMINKNEFAVVAPVVAVAPIVVAPIAVAPIVVPPIAVAPVVVTPVEPSFIPLGRKIKQNQAEQKLGCEICLQELVPAERRTWDPGITQYDVMEQHLEDKGLKKMEQFKIDQLEANLERFKIDQAAINSEAAKQWAFLQATIEKNKVEADRQFAEIMNALKALQPPTTLPVTIPHFEENSGQCFSSDEVEKEELILTSAVNKGDFTSPILAVKEDLGQKLIDDLDEPLMVLESDGMINKNEFAVVAPVVAVAPIVVSPNCVAPIVLPPIAVAPVLSTPVEPVSFSWEEKFITKSARQKLECETVYKN
ncbi:hypothetical protein Tco_0911807 [Tanacetum coccineum]